MNVETCYRHLQLKTTKSAVGIVEMFVLFVVAVVLIAGIAAETAVFNAAHNTTINLTCIDQSSDPDISPPHWVKNGLVALTDDGYTFSRDEDTGALIGTLMINTSGTFSTYCVLHNLRILHNITLIVEGPLPSPENIHINGISNSVVIEWDPPYFANNTISRVVHINPHITQYTVYIIDGYRNYMDKVNVTETSFRRDTSDDHSCPMYGVTAWNSGGEGYMSVPLLGVPHGIAARDVDIHREPGALNIHLNMTDPCTANSFLVTVMSTDGDTIATVQESRPVTTIQVPLPQNVDECNLTVNIRVANSAGISSPTNIRVGGCQTIGHGTDTTTTVITTTSTGNTTATDPDPDKQGDSSVIVIAVGSGATGALLIVALLIVIVYKCKRKIKVKSPEEDVYTQTESPSLGGSPVYQLDSTSGYSVDATTVPHSGTSADSGKSDDALLSAPNPTEPQSPEGNTQLVYARIDPAKRS